MNTLNKVTLISHIDKQRLLNTELINRLVLFARLVVFVNSIVEFVELMKLLKKLYEQWRMLSRPISLREDVSVKTIPIN